MSKVIAPNGMPYPDGNSKLLDTWQAVRDVGLAAAPGFFCQMGRDANENSGDQAWRKLAQQDVYHPETQWFTTGATGIVPKFTGWVEAWGTYRIQSNFNGRRQIGLGQIQNGAPAVESSVPAVTTDTLEMTLSISGLFGVVSGQAITVWSWQNSNVTLLVSNRTIGVRRVA